MQCGPTGVQGQWCWQGWREWCSPESYRGWRPGYGTAAGYVTQLGAAQGWLQKVEWNLSKKTAFQSGLKCGWSLTRGKVDIDVLAQDCSISSALAMDILQSCTKTSIYTCGLKCEVVSHKGEVHIDVLQGCQRSGKSQGKILFFKVREKSGNFVKSQGKSLDMGKSGKSQGIFWWMPMILSLSQSYIFMFPILVPCMDPGGKILTSFLMLYDIAPYKSFLKRKYVCWTQFIDLSKLSHDG